MPTYNQNSTWATRHYFDTTVENALIRSFRELFLFYVHLWYVVVFIIDILSIFFSLNGAQIALEASLLTLMTLVWTYAEKCSRGKRQRQ